jgi:hypothetical protein
VTKKRADGKTDTHAAWARLVTETTGAPPRTLSVADHLSNGKRGDKKVDGRSLRKTGRTQQFNVRLKSDTKQEIQRLADANNWLIGEVIEHAIAALAEKFGRQS